MANQNNLLDFQDSGKLSEELLDMPGFVNELTNYTLDQSHLTLFGTGTPQAFYDALDARSIMNGS